MAPSSAQSGFALLDALIALVLFAVVLLTAMAALLQGMHAMHEAALTGRAVDLAADLLERRRAQPEGAALQPLLDAWNQEAKVALPEEFRATAQTLIQPLLIVDAGAAP